MKSIKNIFLSMLAVAATATLVACGNEKEPEYVPAEQPTTAEVYFPSSVTTSSVDLTDCKGTFEIPVYRVQKGEAQTISLTVSADPIFTVPSTVEFAAGSDVSAVKVTFDDSKVVEDKKYKISLSLGSETSEYGLSAYEFTVVRPSQWLPWGKKDPDDSGFNGTFTSPGGVLFEEPLRALIEYQDLGNNNYNCRITTDEDSYKFSAEIYFTWNTKTNQVRIPAQPVFPRDDGTLVYLGDIVAFYALYYGKDYWAGSGKYKDWADWAEKNNELGKYFYDKRGGFYLADYLFLVDPNTGKATGRGFSFGDAQDYFIADGFNRTIDYNEEYSYNLMNYGEAESMILSADGANPATISDVQMRYNNDGDKCLYHLFNYFGGGYGLTFSCDDGPKDLNAKSEITDVKNEQKTGLIILGQEIYVKVKKGTVEIDKSTGCPVITLTVNAFSKNKAGQKDMDFGNFEEVYYGLETPEVYTLKDLEGAAKADYVGYYNMKAADWFDYDYLIEYPILLMDAGKDEDGDWMVAYNLSTFFVRANWEDPVYLRYKDGYLYYDAQVIDNPLVIGSNKLSVYALGFGLESEQLYQDENMLIAGIVKKNGKLAFTSLLKENVGMVFYVPGAGSLTGVYNICGVKDTSVASLPANIQKEEPKFMDFKNRKGNLAPSAGTFNPNAGVKEHKTPRTDAGLKKFESKLK